MRFYSSSHSTSGMVAAENTVLKKMVLEARDSSRSYCRHSTVRIMDDIRYFAVSVAGGRDGFAAAWAER